tara:strand:+ start:2033 stop:2563 length:531 start_codon:yes stop_codon:yes gene_type:complete
MEPISEQLTMPSGATRSRFDVAIPGQSLTKEPKAYPWESPPQFTTPDEVMDYYFNKFEDDEVLFSLFAMLEAEIPVTTIVNSMIMGAFGEGMYNPDLGVIVAEDLGMLIMVIAEEAGIDYKIGNENKTLESIKTAARLKEALKEQKAAMIPDVKEAIEEVEEGAKSKGLMGPKETK